MVRPQVGSMDPNGRILRLTAVKVRQEATMGRGMRAAETVVQVAITELSHVAPGQVPVAMAKTVLRRSVGLAAQGANPGAFIMQRGALAVNGVAASHLVEREGQGAPTSRSVQRPLGKVRPVPLVLTVSWEPPVVVEEAEVETASSDLLLVEVPEAAEADLARPVRRAAAMAVGPSGSTFMHRSCRCPLPRRTLIEAATVGTVVMEAPVVTAARAARAGTIGRTRKVGVVEQAATVEAVEVGQAVVKAALQ